MNYSSLIPYKVKGILQLLMQQEQKSFLNSLDYLYGSELYNALSDEGSKLWHLSPEKLFDMLKEEKRNNKLVYPDFV